MISAVLDACVLYPAPLRDFLLRLAFAKSFFPLWSEEIHAEWMRNLLQNRPDLKRERLERTRREMDTQFPNSLVREYEPITPMLTLPDSSDNHVLAVAVHKKAEYIVTFNLRDFPKSVLAPYRVEAVSPDDFTVRIINYDVQTFIDTVAKHRTFLNHLTKTVEEYLATLEKQGLSKTVAFLWEHTAEL